MKTFATVLFFLIVAAFAAIVHFFGLVAAVCGVLCLAVVFSLLGRGRGYASSDEVGYDFEESNRKNIYSFDLRNINGTGF